MSEFSPLWGGNEGYGAYDDEEEQEKLPGSCAPRQRHNCPQCGQFQGMGEGVPKTKISS